MILKPVLAALLLSLGAISAHAAPNAAVEGVQMPAWVERDGSKQPLAPGMELRDSDKLSTGQNSRILLRLADGSQVKLGENALLSMDKLGQRQENRQLLVQAAMDVVRGAFRFTTDTRAKLIGRRDVSIRVATVTAGIRGTDLWGKSSEDRDIVCLIEGRIAVQREAEAAVTMDQALQFYISPKAQGRPDPARAAQLAAIDPKQLEQWAMETEIGAGQGAVRRGGKWKVVALSSPDERAALAAYDRLRTEGYPATLLPRGAGAKRTFDVRIGGLPSRDEAQALGARIDSITGEKSWATL